MEATGIVIEYVERNWFRRFEEGDTNFEDKPRSRKPSVVEDEALSELGLPQSTINRHYSKFGVMNRRRCREVLPELTNDQAQRRTNKQIIVGRSSRCLFLVPYCKCGFFFNESISVTLMRYEICGFVSAKLRKLLSKKSGVNMSYCVFVGISRVCCTLSLSYIVICNC